MQILKLTVNHKLNESLQVGDNVYHSSPSSSGGFNVVNSTNGLTHIGVVYNILSTKEIEVYSTYVDNTGAPLPGIIPVQDNYISFSKNRTVNNNNLTGYYSLVEFKNNSKTKAEMFAAGSVVTESSK